MPTAKAEETIDNDFVDGELDVDKFDGANVPVTVPAGPGGGAYGTAGAAGAIDGLRSQLRDMRDKIQRSLKIQVRANTTEQLCRMTAEGGGEIVPDAGVRVVLPGAKPGEGQTILPTPGPGLPGPQNNGGSGSSERLEDGQVIYYSKGFTRFEHHGLDTIIRMTARDGRSPREQGAPPRLASGFPVMMVPNLREASRCKTFGQAPVVVISPPIGMNITFRVEVSGIIVGVSFSLKVTPVSASFSRLGLCWQGVCDGRDEVLEGTVFCSVNSQFSVSASGKINFGPLTIGGVAGSFSAGVEVPKAVDFRIPV